MRSFSFPAEIKRNDATTGQMSWVVALKVFQCVIRGRKKRGEGERGAGKGGGKRKGGRIVAHIGWAAELGQLVFVALFGPEGSAVLPGRKEGNVSRFHPYIYIYISDSLRIPVIFLFPFAYTFFSSSFLIFSLPQCATWTPLFLSKNFSNLTIRDKQTNRVSFYFSISKR